MPLLTALIAGFVFGLGLLVSGMANPAKVLGFLDLAGRWDPSLAVVMVTAIPVAAIAFLIAGRRGRTLLGGALRLPTARDVDAPLVLGSLVFGAGWGLAGLCPAPGLLLLGAGRVEGVWFVAAMLVGMGVHAIVERWRHPVSTVRQS
jgi:uncharacterized membrane protein YedE/YeeE